MFGSTGRRHPEATTSKGAEGGSGTGGDVNDEQVTELLYQALETEQGGVKVYQTALRCAVNGAL